MKNYCLKNVGDAIGLDEETMNMLLEEFFSVMDEEIEKLGAAVKDNDADLIRHLAHKMKGASASMMVDDLSRYCSDLQDADKTDNSLVQSLYSKISASYIEFKSLF